MQFTSEEFARYYKENHRSLYITAYRIVNEKDSAEDIVQDVFFKLWNQRGSIDITNSVKAYLHKATSNAAINFLRRNNRLTRINETHIHYTAADFTSQALTLKELQAHIVAAMNRLPPRCRAVFVLNRLEGMKYKEIAEHLEISVNTVENQMVKALEIMRQELKPILGKEFLIAAVSFGLSALMQLLSVAAIFFLISIIK